LNNIKPEIKILKTRRERRWKWLIHEGKFLNKNFEKWFHGNIYINNKPYNSSNKKNEKPTTFYNKKTVQKKPVKCWECVEPNYFKDCPHRTKNDINIYIVQESTTIIEISRGNPNIIATLKNKQVYHQASIVEVEGMLNSQPIYILIDPCAIISFVSPKIVEMCKLWKEKFEKAWLVQLAT
jgi:hypothetical protein